MFQKIRELSKDLAIYGLGDVAIQLVNFLLLRVYVQYLSMEDYGILALLGSVEAIAKLFFRWGVDGSFMRFWYDCEDDRARQRLSSTLFFFLLIVNGVLLVAAVAAAPLYSSALAGLGGPRATLALQLVLLNTFAIGFTFIPFHVLRMRQRAREFSVLAFARSASTLLLRLALVVGLGYGVLGVVAADLVVTAALLAVMVRYFSPLIRPVFSAATLREALTFGLPRIPHGFAQQVIAVGDKFVLTRFVPLADVGLYSMGVSVGLIQKVFLAAFEYAWAPFYYATVREPGAQRIFSAVTTYGVAVLALMTAGLSAIAGDLLRVVTHGQYTAAAGVVAWTSLGVFFQGIYLMTSIGLNITRRTQVLSGLDGDRRRREHRAQLPVDPALRHHGRRVRERHRLRGAGGDCVRALAAGLSDRLRDRAARQDRWRCDRRLRRRQRAAGHAGHRRHLRPRHHRRRDHGGGAVDRRVPESGGVGRAATGRARAEEGGARAERDHGARRRDRRHRHPRARAGPRRADRAA